MICDVSNQVNIVLGLVLKLLILDAILMLTHMADFGWTPTLGDREGNALTAVK